MQFSDEKHDYLIMIPHRHPLLIPVHSLGLMFHLAVCFLGSFNRGGDFAIVISSSFTDDEPKMNTIATGSINPLIVVNIMSGVAFNP